MKARQIHLLLLSFIVMLLVLNAYLYRQNVAFQHQNRSLILQNDSVLSINLELMNNVNKATKTAIVTKGHNR